MSCLVVLGVVWSSWGGLERSRAVLGRPLVAATPRVRYFGRFLDRRGAQEGAKTEPKDDQKAILKSMQKTLACYNGLKTDLGRSWADVGAILGSQEGENRALA